MQGVPSPHARFLEGALPKLRADPRLLGVAAGGSWQTPEFDEESDLDLILVLEGPIDARELAAALGPLLTCFTGEHVGAPDLLICLYGPPPLHVDFDRMTLDEVGKLPRRPVVLWDRDGEVARRVAGVVEKASPVDRAWCEDRIWAWVYYLASKIKRGELFEVLDGLAFVRARVLGPLIAAKEGGSPCGVRRIEGRYPQWTEPLGATVGDLTRGGCLRALEATVGLYRQLAPQASTPAEEAVREYLRTVPGE
ncbi:MAG: oxalate:formate antiporter [Planctomycetota bacterium]|jgi:hypothetical protein